MRTDGEIERLSEMPADSINLPPGKRGTSARPAVAARRLGYINHATGRKRAWQLLARFRHGKTADGLPLFGRRAMSDSRHGEMVGLGRFELCGLRRVGGAPRR